MFWNKKEKERVDNLELEVSELKTLIQGICQHKGNYRVYDRVIDLVSTDPLDKVFPPFNFAPEIGYFKKCADCGKEIAITRAEYLAYQKETIESSLKECE